jgi:MFS family permease
MLKLDKKYTIASSNYNRWLVPPAALAIHLCIGMAYGFSVFWLPLSNSTGWAISSIMWLYTLFFVFLGASAATWGHWLEKAGPRKAGFVSTICWSGSFFISAFGIYTETIWLLWIGSGVIGGIGLGLGYISPVSTLIKWFPDKKGLATGMAIMGFGGGAMIGSPLANHFIIQFSSETSAGVWETFIVLGIIYFFVMMFGTYLYRLPPQDHIVNNNKHSTFYVHVHDAHKTRQFWLLWFVLCLNVSAGIGIIGMASPMIQEIFGGKLIGLDLTFEQLNESQLKEIAVIGAAFTGLLSLFNILGRIGWASLSDYIGRKLTYFIFFGFGSFLYLLITITQQLNLVLLFVICFCIILTFYGGGFATIPAYLSDIFGTKYVGAIHGRLLTAWSVAGIVGPSLVSYLREYQIERGVERSEAYMNIMYILSLMLVIGLVCNYFVKPIDEKWKVTEV